ncbi:DUF6082 family protein [Streptomyces sp. NPDC051001]|uniref:DUF6082 family protein n=1 Tax=Streptomyces sp. NPDC051001 TaxID=3155795 RepID=UPI003420E57C
MAVPNQEESILEALQQVAQQLGRMADGYDRIATELHRANLIQLHGYFLGRLDRAIDDPPLAAALSALTDLSDEERRQMPNANAQYGLILLAYRVGSVDRSELLGSLRWLLGSPVFSKYWERTAETRRGLPEDSLEARVGRAVDVIRDERLEDLDEWWVVDPESMGE